MWYPLTKTMEQHKILLLQFFSQYLTCSISLLGIYSLTLSCLVGAHLVRVLESSVHKSAYSDPCPADTCCMFNHANQTIAIGSQDTSGNWVAWSVG